MDWDRDIATAEGVASRGWCLLAAAAVVGLVLGACGGGNGPRREVVVTSTTELLTTTTLVVFCDKAPSFSGRAKALLDDVPTARSEQGALARFSDELRSLAQAARELPPLTPPELASAVSDIVGTLDDAERAFDGTSTTETTTEPPTTATRLPADVPRRLSEPRFRTAFERFDAYVAATCLGGTTTTGPGTSTTATGATTTARRPTTTTSRPATTTAGPAPTTAPRPTSATTVPPTTRPPGTLIPPLLGTTTRP